MNKVVALLLIAIVMASASAPAHARAAVESSEAAPAPEGQLPFEIRQALHTSAEVLLNVVRPGYNPIPLAVLNKTQCVVFVNSKGAANAWGIASCRLSPNDWTGPAIVAFETENPAKASRQRELIVLLVTDRAVRSLMNRQLKLGSTAKTQPGPLVTDHANMTEDDITADMFTYGRVGVRTLTPAAIEGTVTVDRGMTSGLYSGRANVTDVLTGHARVPKVADRYLTAVSSFFNTITPIGIMLHHSATLPGNNRVPTDERQVDAFHQKRGFAVACFGKTYYVAYHYFILPSGKIKAGRPENCQGAHAFRYNGYLGISLAGDFSSVDNPLGAKGLTRPTKAQMKSLYALSKRIMQRYGIPPERVLRHSDVANTNCPGDRFPFPAVKKQLASR
ncbi:MAG TPA: N-acetylmuramoyl-L-alanine amidase [Terriglobales bacterium]|nr:N-acetylmuramoyl-L-alanine amidase [Terriglobales bacterium]